MKLFKLIIVMAFAVWIGSAHAQEKERHLSIGIELNSGWNFHDFNNFKKSIVFKEKPKGNFASLIFGVHNSKNFESLELDYCIGGFMVSNNSLASIGLGVKASLIKVRESKESHPYVSLMLGKGFIEDRIPMAKSIGIGYKILSPKYYELRFGICISHLDSFYFGFCGGYSFPLF